MRTKLDPDDEFFIPEIDFSKVEFVPNPRIRAPGDKTEICLDGAIEYQVRLIPSTKVIGRFVSTLDAWPAVIAAIEGGRSPRTLSLDAIGAAGQRWHMAAGPFLERFARLNNGEPHPYADRVRPVRRRVAEGAA
ncbi:MAG: hypothetical protein Q7S35_12025 [Candidatus Limnocylindrales bacterium]|nr:hypothetical protein [Candidatus Limnocylindrales bacterium]